MSIPSSIADNALGLTPSEVRILRQQQELAAQQYHQAQAASRGRGHSRTSNPSSRDVSAASSQNGQGRVFLDPSSLQRLNARLDELMRRIQERIDVLDEATRRSVEASSDRAGNAIQDADTQIARMKRIISELDALEENLDSVRRVRDVVKQLKARVDDADRRLDRASGHGRGGGHGHGYPQGARGPRR